MNKRILIVDDDRLAVDLYREVLTAKHPDWVAECVTSNATEGLKRSLSGSWDLLVWDSMMLPGPDVPQSSPESVEFGKTSGVEAIRIIRQRLGEKCPKILGISVFYNAGSEETVTKEFDKMRLRCLTKGFSGKELVQACEDLLDDA
jgi:CheY-like chemotaxis protein